MNQLKPGEKQQRFAELIWEKEPIGTRALTELCAESFGWKRTTTYTMLKSLCDRGLFENREGTVIALMSREDFGVAQGKELLQESFGGSLPSFLAAFSRRNRLSGRDIEELQRLIDEHREE